MSRAIASASVISLATFPSNNSSTIFFLSTYLVGVADNPNTFEFLLYSSKRLIHFPHNGAPAR